MKLTEPYPLRERTFGQSVMHSLAEGLFLYAFFVLFEPFQMSTWHDEHKYLKLAGFALATSLSTLFNREALPRLFPGICRESEWVVWKEIVSTLVVLLTIATANFLYGNWLFHWGFTWIGFLQNFVSVVMIGFFPVTFWVLMDYNLKMRKYSKPIEISHVTEKPLPVRNVRLTAENEKDIIEANESDLLFIESSDNYSTVHYLMDGQLRKELLRSSLSRLEGQLQSERLVRCHRSYIANLSKVEKVSGNAQGFRFHLTGTDQQVPVARKYSYLVEGLR